jgi:hypothetical protein
LLHWGGMQRTGSQKSLPEFCTWLANLWKVQGASERLADRLVRVGWGESGRTSRRKQDPVMDVQRNSLGEEGTIIARWTFFFFVLVACIISCCMHLMLHASSHVACIISCASSRVIRVDGRRDEPTFPFSVGG